MYIPRRSMTRKTVWQKENISKNEKHILLFRFMKDKTNSTVKCPHEHKHEKAHKCQA